MKKFLWGIIAFNSAMPMADPMDMEQVRINYSKAVYDKTICRQMIDVLERGADNNLSLAYLGGFQAIWANHVLNPVSKMETFYKGKANIEKAILKDSSDVEVRFIRLSIQEKSPWFLGYRQHLQQDRDFLIRNRKEITSIVLAQMLEDILKEKKKDI